MKAFLRACLVALTLLALSPMVHAWGTPVQFDCGASAHWGVTCGKCNVGTAKPWYTYFPYNAYFQAPAPVGGWPFWPTAATPAYPAGTNFAPKTSMFSAPRGIQPVGYIPPSPPSYWYGR
jgi:hypothetical protein